MAVSWALAQRGSPYSYGGDCRQPWSGQRTHECDCSSLVQMAYRTAGVKVGRTTRQQVHAGIAVGALTSIRPGDLVFIPGADGTMAAPGHVGLYIGHGLLVHAPHAGQNIQLAALRTWAASVAAIRRPLG
jgi:cell wall-associated NlpC family hydrolase